MSNLNRFQWKQADVSMYTISAFRQRQQNAATEVASTGGLENSCRLKKKAGTGTSPCQFCPQDAALPLPLLLDVDGTDTTWLYSLSSDTLKNIFVGAEQRERIKPNFLPLKKFGERMGAVREEGEIGSEQSLDRNWMKETSWLHCTLLVVMAVNEPSIGLVFKIGTSSGGWL